MRNDNEEDNEKDRRINFDKADGARNDKNKVSASKNDLTAASYPTDTLDTDTLVNNITHLDTHLDTHLEQCNMRISMRW